MSNCNNFSTLPLHGPIACWYNRKTSLIPINDEALGMLLNNTSVAISARRISSFDSTNCAIESLPDIEHFILTNPILVNNDFAQLLVISIRVETGLDHPGYPGQPSHFLSGSSGSDPVYKISRSDPDSAMDHVR